MQNYLKTRKPLQDATKALWVRPRTGDAYCIEQSRNLASHLQEQEKKSKLNPKPAEVRRVETRGDWSGRPAIRGRVAPSTASHQRRRRRVLARGHHSTTRTQERRPPPSPATAQPVRGPYTSSSAFTQPDSEFSAAPRTPPSSGERPPLLCTRLCLYSRRKPFLLVKYLFGLFFSLTLEINKMKNRKRTNTTSWLDNSLYRLRKTRLKLPKLEVNETALLGLTEIPKDKKIQ